MGWEVARNIYTQVLGSDYPHKERVQRQPLTLGGITNIKVLTMNTHWPEAQMDRLHKDSGYKSRPEAEYSEEATHCLFTRQGPSQKYDGILYMPGWMQCQYQHSSQNHHLIGKGRHKVLK